MKKLSFLLILCQLMLAACSNQGSNGHVETVEAAGITGGQKVVLNSELSRTVVIVDSAKRGEVGFIRDGVEVFPVERTICTGTFITEDIVLTAAHCIKEAPFRMRIMYSEDSSIKAAKHSLIEQVIVHKDYVNEGKTIKNDIALIKIRGQRPAEYSISTVTTEDATKKTIKMLSLGYGLTGEHKADGGILRRVISKINGYQPTSPTFEIDQSSGSGVCQGDSGGPGFVLKNGEFAVLGIVSSVYNFVDEKNKFSCKHFGVYTNVSYHTKWILDAIQQLDGATSAH